MDNKQKSHQDRHRTVLLIVGGVGVVLVALWIISLRMTAQISEEERAQAFAPFQEFSQRMEDGYQIGTSASTNQ